MEDEDCKSLKSCVSLFLVFKKAKIEGANSLPPEDVRIFRIGIFSGHLLGLPLFPIPSHLFL